MATSLTKEYRTVVRVRAAGDTVWQQLVLSVPSTDRRLTKMVAALKAEGYTVSVR
jgi:hypothetical protein